MHIEIKSLKVDERKGTTKSGDDFISRSQTGWVWTEQDEFPFKIQISLQRDQPAFSLGTYQLADSSYKANGYGQLEIDRYNMQLDLFKMGEAKAAAK